MLHLHFLRKYLLLLTKTIVTEDKWPSLHLDPVLERNEFLNQLYL